MKIFSIVGLTLFGALRLSASAESALARVVEVNGAIHGGGSIKAGSTLPTGTAITTGSASKVTFTPFPNGVVSFSADTNAAINRIDVGREGGKVARQAAFQLQSGALFFAVDAANWDATQLEVVTPQGKVSAKRPTPPKTASAGVVEVRNGQLRVVTETGRIVWENPNGQSIIVNAGSFLSSKGSGFQLVDLTTGQTTNYNAKGAPTETRAASAAELKASTEAFSKATQATEALVASRAINSKISKAISETLNDVNQKLAGLGAEPVNGEAVGAAPVPSSSESLPALTDSTNVNTGNPANTSGNVRSPER